MNFFINFLKTSLFVIAIFVLGFKQGIKYSEKQLSKIFNEEEDLDEYEVLDDK